MGLWIVIKHGLKTHHSMSIKYKDYRSYSSCLFFLELLVTYNQEKYLNSNYTPSWHILKFDKSIEFSNLDLKLNIWKKHSMAELLASTSAIY